MGQGVFQMLLHGVFRRGLIAGHNGFEDGAVFEDRLPGPFLDEQRSFPLFEQPSYPSHHRKQPYKRSNPSSTTP